MDVLANTRILRKRIIHFYPKMFKTSPDANGRDIYKNSGSVNSYTIGSDLLGDDIKLYPIWE